MMGTMREKTPICTSGWTATQACSNRRATVECMVKDHHLKEITDTVPEVTALAEARVPDITTRALIWKGVKKNEDHSVWLRRKSTSTLQQEALVKTLLVHTEISVTSGQTATIRKGATIVTMDRTEHPLPSRDQQTTGMEKITELKCRSLQCGCVVTGQNISAVLVNATTSTVNQKCLSGRSQGSGMIVPGHLTEEEIIVPNQVPQLHQSHVMNEQDIPVPVNVTMVETGLPTWTALVLVRQTNTYRDLPIDPNHNLWMCLTHPTPPDPPSNEQTLSLGVILPQQRPLTPIITVDRWPTPVTQDTHPTRTLKETMFILTVLPQGTLQGDGQDLIVIIVGLSATHLKEAKIAHSREI